MPFERLHLTWREPAEYMQSIEENNRMVIHGRELGDAANRLVMGKRNFQGI